MSELSPNSFNLSEYLFQKRPKDLIPSYSEVFNPHDSELPVIDTRSVYKIKKHLEGSSELPDIHHHVLTRVSQEVPSLIEDFEEMGVDQHLFDEDLSGKKNGVTVRWEDAEIIKKCDGGMYFPNTRTITLSYRQPSYTERILSLGIKGKLHNSILIYGHEFAHDLQYKVSPKNGPFAEERSPNLPTELMEAQAYLVSHSDLNKSQLFNHISKAKDNQGQPIYPKMDYTKLNSSLESFRLLNVWGVPQPEIARLVNNPGSWNEIFEDFSNIFDKILLEKRKSKTTDHSASLEDRALSSLKQDQEVVRRIVYRELKELVGENVLSV
jgi:hypothetical protein